MTTTFYLFYGTDQLGIDEAVAKLRGEMGDDANADLNISEFDGTTASVPEIINAVSSFPFLADKRLAIVRGLVGWLTRKGAGKTGKDALARLEEALPNLPDYARMVMVEPQELSDKNAIVKLATSAKNGYCKAFMAPKDSTAWIIARARDQYAATIENRAASALAAVTGDDLMRADNELVKLVNYVNSDRPITEEDVVALTPYVAEANIFKMVDAIAEGRGELALTLLHRLLADKDQDVFGLYGMIIRQFRMLLLAREYLDTGQAPGGVASALKVRPFVAQNLTRQVRGFDLEQLEQIYHNLAETDLKMKTGQITPLLALDLFVASLTRS